MTYSEQPFLNRRRHRAFAADLSRDQRALRGSAAKGDLNGMRSARRLLERSLAGGTASLDRTQQCSPAGHGCSFIAPGEGRRYTATHSARYSLRRETRLDWWVLTKKMADPVHDGVTRLLVEWRNGDPSALERLMPLVYADLRKLARRCLRGEREGHTLQTTGLVNEVYLRLVGSSRVQWRDRAHFFALATQLMRRVLVDEARRRQYQKRGGEYTRVTLDEAEVVAPERHVDLVELDDALQRLSRVAPRKGRVVEMRFFGGLTIEETAAVLDVSTDIVKREWRTAKLWLLRALNEADHGDSAVEPH